VAANVLFGKSEIYIAAQNKLWIESGVETFCQLYVNNVLMKCKKGSVTTTNATITTEEVLDDHRRRSQARFPL
jgi:hypothetical protein